MSGNNIISVTLDNSNITSRERVLDFNIDNGQRPLVDNSFDYEAYIKKAEIPISKTLPLYNGRQPLKLTLEATDKDNKPLFFGEELFVTFDLGSSFTSLEQLVRVINDKLVTQLGTFYWCRFEILDSSRLAFVVSDHTKTPLIRVWMDTYLEGLLEELPVAGSTTIQGHEYVEMISPKPENKSYEQAESMMKNFINLKAFRLFTSIPIEQHWIYDQNTGQLVGENMIGEVTFNSREMVGNSNLLYIPTIYNYNSLTDAGTISKVRLNVMAYYASGLYQPTTLDKGSYTSITVVFDRKVKI